jgi:hypothetical protein
MSSSIRTATRVLAAFVVAALLPVVGPWVLRLPAAAADTAATITSLGPSAGWRCLQGSGLQYDPRRSVPVRTFLRERPEVALASDLGSRPFVATRVDVTLDGSAMVYGELRDATGQEVRRVFTMHAGASDPITTYIPNGEVGCATGLRAWQVLGERAGSAPPPTAPVG